MKGRIDFQVTVDLNKMYETRKEIIEEKLKVQGITFDVFCENCMDTIKEGILETLSLKGDFGSEDYVKYVISNEIVEDDVF